MKALNNNYRDLLTCEMNYQSVNERLSDCIMTENIARVNPKETEFDFGLFLVGIALGFIMPREGR